MADRKADPKIITRIKAPRRKDGKPSVVGQQFMMTVVLTGRQAGAVTVALYKNGTEVPDKIKTRNLTTRPAKRPKAERPAHKDVPAHQWVILVTLPDTLKPDVYQLRATPVKAGSGSPVVRYDEVDIDYPKKGVVQTRGVTIDYPEDGYEIGESEQEFFYVTGGSDVPVWNATLGGRSANYAVWVPELNYWVAEFLYLNEDPGPGEYTLAVDIEGGPSCTVYII